MSSSAYGGEAEARRLAQYTQHNHNCIPLVSEDRREIWCMICEIRLARTRLVPGCTRCHRGDPPHYAHAECESGGHDHCACDVCY